MADKFELNDTVPSAPANRVNVKWQYDALGNISAHVATDPVVSVFGRTGAITAQAGDYTAAQVTNAVSTAGSYADPAWITSLAWGKVSGAPSVASYQTPWVTNIDGNGKALSNVTSYNGLAMQTTDSYPSAQQILHTMANGVTYVSELYGNGNATYAGNVNAAGGVYIATPASAYRLDVASGGVRIQGANAGGIDNITALNLERGYDAVGDTMDIVWGPQAGALARISGLAYAGGCGAFVFYCQGTGAAGNTGYTNEVMRVQGNSTGQGVGGKVGIGTASPGFDLHVANAGTCITHTQTTAATTGYAVFQMQTPTRTVQMALAGSGTGSPNQFYIWDASMGVMLVVQTTGEVYCNYGVRAVNVRARTSGGEGGEFQWEDVNGTVSWISDIDSANLWRFRRAANLYFVLDPNSGGLSTTVPAAGSKILYRDASGFVKIAF